MLIRIVPDMFIDARYECCTIIRVRPEIFKKQRFKKKYPWRSQFKDKVRCLSSDLVKNDQVSLYFDAITSLLDDGVLNQRTGNEFDLSYADKKILACALANGYWISSGDEDLKGLGSQEFGKQFKGSISPLGILNRWLRKGLIKWNDTLHGYIADWNRDEEHPQPKRQKIAFKKLTSRDYPGS